MPYSKSESAIIRVSPYLDMMVSAAKSHTNISWETDNADKLTHQLREGMKAAAFLPTKYAKYSNLFNLFIIRKKYKEGTQIVEADLRIKMKPASFTPATIDEVAEPFDKVKVEQSGVIANEVLTVEGAILSVIDRPASEVYFPNFNATEDELNQLYKFAKEKGLNIINHGPGGCSITRKDIGDLAWKPGNVE